MPRAAFPGAGAAGGGGGDGFLTSTFYDSVGEESSAAIRKTIKGAFKDKVRFREFLYFVGVFKDEPGWQLNQSSSLATQLTF
eukprot:3037027-Prymnesium_polylepis.1